MTVTAAAALQEIHRIHDDDPPRAAAALRALEAAALPPEQRPLFGFLCNHLLGEKLGCWSEAADRMAPLAAQPQAGVALLRHHAVACLAAGRPTAQAIERLAAEARATPALAALAVELGQLGFTPAPATVREALPRLARQAAAYAPSGLDGALAAGFNNVATGLYYATRSDPMDDALRQALVQAAEAALLFWCRAGGWQEHERALYLVAKVALRVGEPLAAACAAERGLAIVAAHGDDPVEKAFLLQLLAAAVRRGGNEPRGSALQRAADELGAGLDDELRGALASDAAELVPPLAALRAAFIGGGNMAGALLHGLVRAGAPAALQQVVEPLAARRAALEAELGVTTLAQPQAALRAAGVVVLAVKPQQLREACAQLRPHLQAGALVVSVAAGVRARDIARWLGTEAVVRTMPNTPALIGRGVTGMAALPAVSAAHRAQAEALLAGCGPVVWFDDEAQLDAVTAVSGSGPAYVFFFIEALMAAGTELGLAPAQARALALATFTGAAELAARADEPPALLRERVTSKGGTTAAALAVLGAAHVNDSIVRAVAAAQARAQELAEEFGRG